MRPTNRTTAPVAYLAVLAALLLASGCGAEPSSGLDGGLDAWHPEPVDAGRDTGADVDLGPPATTVCDDGCVGVCLPRRCADQPIPGFRLRPDGLYQPCNCFDFEDPSSPPVPVATACRDQGLRTVVFDCDWPPGTIDHRGYTSSGPADIGAMSCGHTCAIGTRAGHYRAPYEQLFFVSEDVVDPRLPVDRICVPRECVFDTPGERARCSRECALPIAPGVYVTVYRVDRRLCDDPDPDGGTSLPPPVEGC